MRLPMAIEIPTDHKWNREQIKAIEGLFADIAKTHPYGLVVFKFTDGTAPYMKGEIAGLEPPQAARMFRFRMGYPCKSNGEPIEFSGIPQSEQAPAASSNEVDIPSDWEATHHLQRIRLAKEIAGTDEPLTVVAADEIIRAELQRRGDR
jgi:hypothetical protein